MLTLLWACGKFTENFWNGPKKKQNSSSIFEFSRDQVRWWGMWRASGSVLPAELAIVPLGQFFSSPVSKIERAELIHNLWQRHEKAASNRH